MAGTWQLIWLLVIYILAQIGSLYVGGVALIYLLVYLMALVTGSRVVYAFILNKEPAEKLLVPFLLFFLANLIICLFYIPTLFLNPEIKTAMIVLFTVTVIAKLKRRAA